MQTPPRTPKLITYCCVATAHWERRGMDAMNIVTIHEREWAYCPAGDSDRDGHDWMRTEGLALGALEAMRAAPESRRAPAH